MASVYCGNSSGEYSAVDGRICHFTLDSEVLFDSESGVNVNGWQERCWRWVLMNKGFWCYESLKCWSHPAFVDWLDAQLSTVRKLHVIQN